MQTDLPPKLEYFIRWCMSEQAWYDFRDFPALRRIETEFCSAYLPIHSLEESKEYLLRIPPKIIADPERYEHCHPLWILAGFESVKKSRWIITRMKQGRAAKSLLFIDRKIDDKNGKGRVSEFVHSCDRDECRISDTDEIIAWRHSFDSRWTIIIENLIFAEILAGLSQTRPISSETLQIEPDNMFRVKHMTWSKSDTKNESHARKALHIPGILMIVMEYSDFAPNVVNSLAPLFRLSSNMGEKTFNHLMMMSFCDRSTLSYVRIPQKLHDKYFRDIFKTDIQKRYYAEFYPFSEMVLFDRNGVLRYPDPHTFEKLVHDHLKHFMKNLDHNFDGDPRILSRDVPIIFYAPADGFSDFDIRVGDDYDYRNLLPRLTGSGLELALNDVITAEGKLSGQLWRCDLPCGKSYLSKNMGPPGKIKLKGIVVAGALFPECIRHAIENNIEYKTS